jgi:hypothetical protein
VTRPEQVAVRSVDYSLTVRLDSFIGQYTVDRQHLFAASAAD